jgi:putative transcriptional regulator
MYSLLYIGDGMKNRLEEFRIRNGWTQQELANRVDVSRQTIISLESGRYNPSILLAFRLSSLFKLKIEDLFLYSEEEEHHG